MSQTKSKCISKLQHTDGQIMPVFDIITLKFNFHFQLKTCTTSKKCVPLTEMFVILSQGNFHTELTICQLVLK